MNATPRLHFEEVDWLDYVEGSADSSLAHEMSQHLGECPSCRRRLDEMRELAVALPFAGEIIDLESREAERAREPFDPPEIVLRARAGADEIAPDREQSRREILEAFSVSGAGPIAWTPTLFEAARALTRELLRSDVPLAGRIARAALSALEGRFDSAEIRRDGIEGVLRTVVAYVLHRERESAAALEELELARPIIEKRALVPEDDLAFWSYIRALALSDLGRADDALEALDLAESLYRLLDDFPRRARCQVVRAVIHASLGRREEAVRIYEDLLRRDERELDDERLVGIIQLNLGSDLIYVDRLSDAKRAYARAAEILRRTGEQARLTALRAGLATIAFREGRYQDAYEIAIDLRRRYRSEKLGWDEIYTELRIVETLLHLGRPAEAAETCRRVLPRIHELGLSSEAARAVEYLTEAELDLVRVEKVSRFLERARRDDTQRWSAA